MLKVFFFILELASKIKKTMFSCILMIFLILFQPKLTKMVSAATVNNYTESNPVENFKVA